MTEQEIKERILNHLQSIAIQSVEAQSNLDDLDKLIDLLDDIERDTETCTKLVTQIATGVKE